MRGEFVPLTVPGHPAALSRQGRVAQHVSAFLPHPLHGLTLSLSGAQAADLSDAEAALAKLRQTARATPALEAAAWRLLRAEAVASSQIEAVDITHRRLARAEAGGEGRRHERAAEALANVRAMQLAIEGAQSPLLVDDIRSYHDSLLATSPHPIDVELAGRFRDRAVWIGGTTAASADYVAPPHDEVPRLVDDLVRFINERQDLSAVALAAIAHAQFETIHPFHDGNGRVGRCLVHAVLRIHGGTGPAIAPVSLVLKADTPSYIDGLVHFRNGDVEGWTARFAVAVTMACTAALDLANGIVELRDQWASRIARARQDAERRAPRRNSTAMRLLDVLAASPVISVPAIAAQLGVSNEAANNAVAELEGLGIIKQVSIGRRNRVHEAHEVFALLTRVESSIGAA